MATNCLGMFDYFVKLALKRLRLQFTILKFSFGQQLFECRFNQNVKHVFNPSIHLNVSPTHFFVLTVFPPRAFQNVVLNQNLT